MMRNIAPETKLLITIALAFHLIFVWLWLFPFSYAPGKVISPSVYSFISDMEYYRRYAEKICAAGWRPLLADILHYYRIIGGIDAATPPPPPGVLLPALMCLSGYAPGQTLLLAAIWLESALAFSLLSAWWLMRRGGGLFWAGLFAFSPYTLFHGFVIGADMPAALLVFATFLAVERAVRLHWRAKAYALALGLAVAAALSRPTGPQALLILHGALLFLPAGLPWRRILGLQVLTAVFTLAGIWYYFPYFHWFITVSGDYQPVGGIAQSYLISGLGDLWNDPLLYLRQGAELLGRKLLMLSGYYPSDSGSLYGLSARFAFGVFLLLGFIATFIRGRRLEILALLVVLSPMLFGHTMARYLLPVMPVIFLHAVMVLRLLWRRWAGR